MYTKHRSEYQVQRAKFILLMPNIPCEIVGRRVGVSNHKDIREIVNLLHAENFFEIVITAISL